MRGARRPRRSTGKRVLVRVDFNVPLDGRRGRRRHAASARRCRRSRSSASRGARAACWSRTSAARRAGRTRVSHGSRRRASAELSAAPVTLAPAVVGDEVAAARRRARARGAAAARERALRAGGDRATTPRFATRAGGARRPLRRRRVRRGPPRARLDRGRRPPAARRAPVCLLEREVESLLGRSSSDPARPLVAVLGGAKVADKIGGHRPLLERRRHDPDRRRDVLPFLRRRATRWARRCARTATSSTPRHILERRPSPTRPGRAAGRPRDRQPSSMPAPQRRRSTASRCPEGWIGARHRAAAPWRRTRGVLADAGTVFWNGPMGVFELAPFAAGTRAVAEAVAPARRSRVVGGGDSVAALRKLRARGRASPTSRPAAAPTLEAVEGKALPGSQALQGAEDAAMSPRTPLIAGNWKMYKTPAPRPRTSSQALLPLVSALDDATSRSARRSPTCAAMADAAPRLARRGRRAEHAPRARGRLHGRDLGADAASSSASRRRARPLRAAPALR